MKTVCPYCDQEFECDLGKYNAAIKRKGKLFCCYEHSCLGGRTTSEDKKAVKTAYDKKHRNERFDEIKAKKQAYNKTPEGRAAQKRRRETRMPKHVEYCRQPAYKEKKVVYDREFRAKKLYGEFWEAAILAEQIDKKITQIADKNDLRTIQGTNNKTQKRKKQWLRLLKNLPQLT